MADSGKRALSSVAVCADGGRASHERSKKRDHGDPVSTQFSELHTNAEIVR